MDIDSALNLLIEETINGYNMEPTATFKVTGADIIFSAKTDTTTRTMLDLTALIVKDELINKIKPKNFGKEIKLAASTVIKGRVLTEESLVTDDEKRAIKSWVTKKIDHVYLTKECRANVAECKKNIIMEVRKINDLDSLKSSMFWDKDLERIFSNKEKKFKELATRLQRSIRGRTSYKFGTGIENIIKNALIKGDYTGVEGLSDFEEVLNSLPTEIRNKIIIKKPKANNLAYDLEIKIPYSKSILFGIHIKLIINEYNVVSMKNKEPIFSSAATGNIKKKFEDYKEEFKKLGIEYSDFIYKIPNKKESATVFKSLEFLKKVYGKLNNPINKNFLVDVITLVCRISNKTTVWVVVFPEGTKVVMSEKVTEIKKEENKFVFLNKDKKAVFKVNVSNGDTSPILVKEGA